MRLVERSNTRFDSILTVVSTALMLAAFVPRAVQAASDTGRWKIGNDGCYWDPNDSGPDQCSPGDPPPAPPSTCSPDDYGANPFDGSPDDGPIQTCLDQGGTILLTPNPNGGYYVANTLVIRRDGTTLTSSTTDKARIIAASSLNGPLLRTDPITGYDIHEVEFNGNKFLRDLRS